MPEVSVWIRQKRRKMPPEMTKRSDSPPSREAREHPLHLLDRVAQERFESPSKPQTHSCFKGHPVAKDAPFGAVPRLQFHWYSTRAPVVVTVFAQLMMEGTCRRMVMEAPGVPSALAATQIMTRSG
jgi:hypothetical protein